MRAYTAKILLIFHLSTLLGYNLFNASHSLLHTLKSSFHQHEHQQQHDIADHHGILQRLKEYQNENSEGQLPQESKTFYYFIYIFTSHEVNFRDFGKVMVLYDYLFLQPYTRFFSIPPTPPPED